MGLYVPEEYGGQGLSQTGYARVFEAIGQVDGSLTVGMGVHQSIGLKGIAMFGTDEQKERFLPDLAAGRKLAGFALTEPNAGSDAYNIESRAVQQSDGSWVLNGEKRWIGNGCRGDVLRAFARAEVDGKDRHIALILEKGMEGLDQSGPRYETLGLHGNNLCPVRFNDVRVPPENVLGEPGEGFRIAMAILNNGRLGLGTGSVGLAKRLLDLTIDHVTERRQFGKPLADFDLVEDKVAWMVALPVRPRVDGLPDDRPGRQRDRGLLGRVGDGEGRRHRVRLVPGQPRVPARAAARGTCTASRTSGSCATSGSSRSSRAPTTCCARTSRSPRSSRWGSSSQGSASSGCATRSGRWARSPSTRSTACGARCGPTRSRRAHEELATLAEPVGDQVKRFRDEGEGLLRKHGKGIIDQGMAHKRLADALADIYAQIAVLSRVTSIFEEQGVEASGQERFIAETFCRRAARRVDAPARPARAQRRRPHALDRPPGLQARRVRLRAVRGLRPAHSLSIGGFGLVLTGDSPVLGTSPRRSRRCVSSFRLGAGRHPRDHRRPAEEPPLDATIVGEVAAVADRAWITARATS